MTKEYKIIDMLDGKTLAIISKLADCRWLLLEITDGKHGEVVGLFRNHRHAEILKNHLEITDS